MNIDRLTSDIKLHEGTGPVVSGRFKPYADTTGKQTIGYGRNLTDLGISQDEADYLLSNDIASAFQTASAQDWWPCVSDNDARSRAMVEILFNLGLTHLNGFVNTINSLRQRDYVATAEGLRNSRWQTQVGWRATVLEHMIQYGEDM